MSDAGAGACPAVIAPHSDLNQNLLIVLIFSNIMLLFLVGLLSRRLERVNANVTRVLKASILGTAQREPVPAAPLSTTPRTSFGGPSSPLDDGGARSPSPDLLARELVNGHVSMLKKTLSNESLRSSLSADDIASLAYMLGDEGGVNM